MTNYQHTQRAPMCLLIYGVAAALLVTAWFLHDVPPFPYLYPPLGVLCLVLAASFHYLAVQDAGDRLMIGFGPVPLFHRSIRYEDILSAEAGRTTVFEGWGIHLSLRGGWVWNLWGRDCVVVRMQRGTLRIGSDDCENLQRFLQSRIRGPR